jgi:high-affinity nickel-transport protein
MLLARIFSDGSEEQRRKMIAVYSLLLGTNVLAWTWALVEFANRPALLGTAFLAYTFGLRHAIDADHIVAIDNVVRKLMQEGKRPLMVGFFFALGHSTVVVLATIVIAATAAALQSRFDGLKAIGSVIGTTVSAGFLLAIAFVNLVILVRVWRSFQHVRRGGQLEAEHLDLLLAGRGFLARLFRGLFRVVSKSWHMFPLGFLFGLGLDTARHVDLVDVDLSGPIYRRHGLGRYYGRRIHGGSLRLGLRQSDPQALVQPHYHCHICAGRPAHRQYRSAGAAW